MANLNDGVAVQARLFPNPPSISVEAQANLTRLINEEGVPLNTLYTMPPADDHAGWLKIKSAGANNMRRRLSRLPGR